MKTTMNNCTVLDTLLYGVGYSSKVPRNVPAVNSDMIGKIRNIFRIIWKPNAATPQVNFNHKTILASPDLTTS